MSGLLVVGVAGRRRKGEDQAAFLLASSPSRDCSGTVVLADCEGACGLCAELGRRKRRKAKGSLVDELYVVC